MKLNVLYEDNHLLVVEKKAGVPVISDRSNNTSMTDSAKAYLKEKYNKPGNVFLGTVHRLDKLVSGVLVFTKTSKAASRLSHAFKSGGVRKFYILLTEKSDNRAQNNWAELADCIRYNDGHPEIAPAGINTKKAVLAYRRVKSSERYSLFLVELMTGRKHQIRVQFAHIGLPIVGDTRYGSSTSTGKKLICLHAFYTAFDHPVRDHVIEIYSPVPERIKSRINITEEEIRAVIT